MEEERLEGRVCPPEEQSKLLIAMQPLSKGIRDIAEVFVQIVVEGVSQRLAEIFQPPAPRYYDRVETARILHVSLPTLKVLSDQGRITPHRSGRRVLFSADQIDELANSGEPVKYASKYRKRQPMSCERYTRWQRRHADADAEAKTLRS